MKTIKTLLSVSALALTTLSFSAAAGPLDDLLKSVKNDRVSEAKLSKEREAEFKRARDGKQALVAKAKKDLNAEKKRQKRLQQDFANNEKRIADKEAELEAAKGTLGEMFGVVRGAAGKAYGLIAASNISAQSEFAKRTELLAVLKEAKAIPSIFELEELWIALQTEMTESGKVVNFNTTVTGLDGSETSTTVTRIGSFNLLADGQYVNFNSEKGLIQPFAKQPDHTDALAYSGDFEGLTAGFSPLYIDPARGALIDLYKQKATHLERYHQGGFPGYVITGVLALGLAIALWKIITLFSVGAKMKSQLKNVNSPSTSNPLGRILKVYSDNKNADVENLELKLDEAILRETPSIESGINIIKILAAIAPLLGLLGTVIGMIGTFQSITLFGTGDPKIMAGNISMALVTTAQGLICALPLIFVHSIVAARGKSIVHVLEEQSAGIIASHAEKEQA